MRQAASVQLPVALVREVLGVELAGRLVVGTTGVPSQQSQLLVDGGHEFGTEVAVVLDLVLFFPVVLPRGVLLGLLVGLGRAADVGVDGDEFLEGDVVVLLEVLLDEVFNAVVESVISL